MKIPSRVPLEKEPLEGAAAVAQYDKGARLYMLPEYKYFVGKIRRRGIKSGRVLDIGTGSGRLAIELAKANWGDFEITGLDVAADMLRAAAANARRAGVADRIEFCEGNAAALPFPNKSFDLVMSYASLHHWGEPERVFAEAQRVVRDGGTVMVRDNQRIYGNPFWTGFVWLLSRLMNRRHRQNWPKAIMASYTLDEVRDIVSKSGLKDYRIGTDFIRFDICVEAPRR